MLAEYLAVRGMHIQLEIIGTGIDAPINSLKRPPLKLSTRSNPRALFHTLFAPLQNKRCSMQQRPILV